MMYIISKASYQYLNYQPQSGDPQIAININQCSPEIITWARISLWQPSTKIFNALWIHLRLYMTIWVTAIRPSSISRKRPANKSFRRCEKNWISVPCRILVESCFQSTATRLAIKSPTNKKTLLYLLPTPVLHLQLNKPEPASLSSPLAFTITKEICLPYVNRSPYATWRLHTVKISATTRPTWWAKTSKVNCSSPWEETCSASSLLIKIGEYKHFITRTRSACSRKRPISTSFYPQKFIRERKSQHCSSKKIQQNRLEQ